ncbi:MAG: extracellular solute-binding protein [Chloroflexi bacterium]|nr:extracellular solute-binding protein [Chloroflexota bacterium]
MEHPTLLTRRQALRAAALTSLGAILAACGGSAAPAPSSPAASPSTAAPATSAAAAKPSVSVAASASAAPSAAAPAGAKPAASGSVASQPAPSPVSQAEWDSIVAAARKEGTVSVNVFPGKGNEDAIAQFNKTYPDIKLVHTTLPTSALAPRILQEYKAGIYTWDVLHQPVTTSLQVMNPAGILQPIRPQLVHPDVVNDAVWRDGFNHGFFLTNDMALSYSGGLNRTIPLLLDTSVVNKDEIKSVKDLLDPKWKGKIVVTDPRISGASFTPLTMARLKYGDDFMKQFLIDQAAVLVQDATSATNMLAHGNQPMAIGAGWPMILDLQKNGIAKGVIQQVLPEWDSSGSGNDLLWFTSKPPHPNAAKVYINWFFSKDGQAADATSVPENSRRTDAPVGNPDILVPQGLSLPDLQQENYLNEITKTQDLAKQLIK